MVNEHGAAKRSCTHDVARPPTGLSIHEPSNTPVISSSDEEEDHIEFRTPCTIQTQSNLTNTVILRGEGSNGTHFVR